MLLIRGSIKGTRMQTKFLCLLLLVPRCADFIPSSIMFLFGSIKGTRIQSGLMFLPFAIHRFHLASGAKKFDCANGAFCGSLRVSDLRHSDLLQSSKQCKGSRALKQ